MNEAGFAWVLNLDAELEMAEPSYCASARVLAQLVVFERAAHTLLGPQDVLLDGLGSGGRGRIGRAWCPTASALARLVKGGAQPEPHPSMDVLRTVNHRKFAADLALGLPEQRYLEERASLVEVLSQTEHSWLLKRPFAFAGRGQQRIFGPIDARQSAWIEASLRRSGLIVEPLVKPTLEVSQHGFLWPSGRHELGRVCVQEVSERGVFRSIRLMRPGELLPDEQQRLSFAAERTATALTAAGYFGPFGIDGYRYVHRDQKGFCSLSEINARYSMGFVTGFPRHPSTIAIE